MKGNMYALRRMTVVILLLFTIEHGRAAVLTVASDGIIETGDPCPEPRGATKYAQVQAAVDCAQNDDQIRLKEGVFGVFNAGIWIIDKNLTLTGQGNSRTLIITDFVVISSDLTIKKITVSDRSGASSGGAMEIVSPSRVVINKCIFTANLSEDAGAIQNNAGNRLIIKNSVFTANHADYWGGAIRNFGELELINSVFSGNTASRGGSIYNEGQLTVSRSLITSNDATDAGGGIYNVGGGTVLLRKSIVTGNTPDDCFGC